jgi:hypothetical protein
MLKLAVLFVVLLYAVAPVSAQTTIDNFEQGNLNAWTPGSSGQIVTDPLNASNHVLHFTAGGDGGDIWTASSFFATGTDWWLSFDYLGLPGSNTGGSIGWDTDTLNAGNERWLASTASGAADSQLIDDGTWHHYVIHLVRGVNLTAGPKFIKAEDWIKADAIIGNAYFDNIVISDFDPAAGPPPVPTLAPILTTSLFGILLALVVVHLRRRSSPPAI